MSKDKTDRIKEFYTAHKKEHGFYPSQSAISRGVKGPKGKIGISRQAVSKYFSKNETALKKIPEYRRYFVDNVNQKK